MIQFIDFVDANTGVTTRKVDIDGKKVIAVESMLNRTINSPIKSIINYAINNPRSLSANQESFLRFCYGNTNTTITKVEYKAGTEDLNGKTREKDEVCTRVESIEIILDLSNPEMLKMVMALAQSCQTQNGIKVD